MSTLNITTPLNVMSAKKIVLLECLYISCITGNFCCRWVKNYVILYTTVRKTTNKLSLTN